MRCPECDYALWNIPARSCPECGVAFKPSEFEFVPNSVRFCCPHCDQTYYGTTRVGHLQPAAFTCVQCNADIDMDDMVLRPAANVSEKQTQAVQLTWLSRRETGFFRAWFGTIKLAMLQPGPMMRATGALRLGPALWFALITQTVYCILFGILFVGISIVSRDPDVLIAFLILAAWAWLFAMGTILIGALFIHAIVAVSGDRRAGPGATSASLAYSSGANVLTAIPCIGGYFGWIWWVVSAVLALKDAQRISPGRAAAAVIGWLVFIVVIVGGGLIGLSIFGVSMAQQQIQAATQRTQAQTMFTMTELADAMQDYAATHNQWPAHPLTLIADPQVDYGGDFTILASTTMSDDIVVRPASTPNGTAITLLAFTETMTPLEQRELLAEIGPPPPVHRIGDTVFVYDGLDPDSPDDQARWAAFTWPMPGSTMDTGPNIVINGVPQGGDWRVAVMKMDGSVSTLPQSEFLIELDAENEARSDRGLLRIPPPDQIR